MNQEESEWLAIYFQQGGPLPAINGLATPLTGVIKPQLAIYKAIYRGPISTFITSRDPPYTFFSSFFSLAMLQSCVLENLHIYILEVRVGLV